MGEGNQNILNKHKGSKVKKTFRVENNQTTKIVTLLVVFTKTINITQNNILVYKTQDTTSRMRKHIVI